MGDADEAVGATTGSGQNTPEERARTEYRIDIGGNAGSPVIAGDHNVVVDAQHGSTVTLLMERERPRPVRRDRVELLPRLQREPVGRGAEIAALDAAVQAGGLVQLWGPPGVGKSTLLRHAVRHLAPGTDGVLYLNAAYREPGDLAQEVFEACYDAVGYAPSDTELRRLMAGVRVTVYVDNAELSREQLLTLADTARDATFVFAGSERSLLGGDGTVLELKGLERAAGLQLLDGELRRPLARSELDAANSLWEAAEGRPLLLLRAAGLARSDSAAGARLPLPGEVAAMLPLLLDQLDHAAITVLHLLATLDGAELDPVHISAMTDLPDAAAVCGRLADLGLVLAEEHGYRCAADTAPAVNQRYAKPFPVDQICRHFARWATLSTTTPAQVAHHSQALDRAAELAELAGRPDLAVRVARAASPSLARSLRFGAWARLLGHGWVAARSAGDKRAEAYFTHEEGIRSLLTGRRVVAAVLLSEALLLWRELGDTHGINAALNAHAYAPPTAPATPAVHGGSTSAAHTGTAGHGTATHGTTAAHTTATHGTTAAHTTAATHATTAAHTTAAVHSTATQTAAAHMASLVHGQAGLGAMTQVPSAAGHLGLTAAGTTGGVHAGTAATTAGGVHAGTAATTAVAVKGVSTITMVLSAIAVVTAVVIGGIAVAQQQATTTTSVADTAPADTGLATPDPGFTAPDSGLTTPDPDFTTPADTDRATPSTPDTDLAGVWETRPGQGVRMITTGPDTYTVEGGNSLCQPLNLELTGSGGSYSGTEALFSESGDSCSPAIGTVTLSIVVSPDGTTAQVDTELTPDEQGQLDCSTCGTETWTRSSQP